MDRGILIIGAFIILLGILLGFIGQPFFQQENRPLFMFLVSLVVSSGLITFVIGLIINRTITKKDSTLLGKENDHVEANQEVLSDTSPPIPSLEEKEREELTVHDVLRSDDRI